MDALEPVLRPLVGLINRRIRATTPALDLCAELAGKTIAVRVRNTAINAYAVIDPDGIRLLGEYEADPEVVISGSLISLAALGSEDAMAAVRDGRIDVSGDVETAESFKKLIELARPDLEDEMSRLVGDATAHKLSELLKAAVSRGRDIAQSFGENVATRAAERQQTPSGDEAGKFTDDVRHLRDATERLEARIRGLADRLSGKNG